jgi:hypothetical protein
MREIIVLQLDIFHKYFRNGRESSPIEDSRRRDANLSETLERHAKAIKKQKGLIGRNF